MFEFRFLAVRVCPTGSKEVISQPLFVEADKWCRTTSSGLPGKTLSARADGQLQSELRINI